MTRRSGNGACRSRSVEHLQYSRVYDVTLADATVHVGDVHTAALQVISLSCMQCLATASCVHAQIAEDTSGTACTRYSKCWYSQH